MTTRTRKRVNPARLAHFLEMQSEFRALLDVGLVLGCKVFQVRFEDHELLAHLRTHEWTVNIAAQPGFPCKPANMRQILLACALADLAVLLLRAPPGGTTLA